MLLSGWKLQGCLDFAPESTEDEQGDPRAKQEKRGRYLRAGIQNIRQVKDVPGSYRVTQNCFEDLQRARRL